MCFFLFYSSSSYEDFCLLFSHSQGIVVWNVTKYVKYVSSFCFEKSQHAQKDVNNINLLWEFFVLVALVVVEWMCPATFQTPPPSKSLRFWVIVFVKHWPKPDQANCVELWGNRRVWLMKLTFFIIYEISAQPVNQRLPSTCSALLLWTFWPSLLDYATTSWRINPLWCHKCRL